MHTKWKLNDLIDLEYFLADLETSEDSRDREIYLRKIRPMPGMQSLAGVSARRAALRYWLDVRRDAYDVKTDASPPLPGDIFRSVHHLLAVVAAVGGILIGAGAAAAVLRYTGRSPVNVWTYLSAFVFSQIGLLCLLSGAILLRRIFQYLGQHSSRPIRQVSVVYSGLGVLMRWLMQKAARRASGTISRDRRDRFQAAFGLLRSRQRIHGAVFFWPVFIILQLFAVGFNLGVMGGSLFRILGTDLAFGWQSTIQLGARGVHEIVSVLAVPWSGWLPPDIACPSLSQIAGSRIVLKEGAAHLATPDLAAWWPFLLLSVCCYGLIPRLLLLLGGWIAQQRRLGRLSFNHTECRRLLQRFETPVLQTHATDVAGNQPGLNDTADPAPAIISPPSAFNEEALLLLVSDELLPAFSESALEHYVAERVGRAPDKILPVQLDMEADQSIVASMAAIAPGGRYRIAALLEAWQPPIMETMLFFKELRQAIGPETAIDILLIGRPAPATPLTPADTRDRAVWARAVRSLGDPYIGLRRERET